MPSSKNPISRRAFIIRSGCIFTGAAGGVLSLPRSVAGRNPDPTLNETLRPGSDQIFSTVSISPELVTAESYHLFQIKIVLGEDGLTTSESLGLVCGSNIDRWQFSFAEQFWGNQQPWQFSNPRAAGFTTAACSRPGACLTLSSGTWGGKKPYVNQPDHFVHSLKDRMRFVLEIASDTDLKAGDEILISWGDRRQGSPGTQSPVSAMDYHFFPFKFSRLPEYDPALPIRRQEFELLPTVRVKGKSTVRFHLAAQPLLGKDERFSLHIAAVDEHGHLDEDFTGSLTLKSSCPGAKIPPSVEFTEKDKGHQRIEGLRLPDPGWHRIQAESDSLYGRSHYLHVTEKPPEQRLYFGDMHGHTLECDGTVPLKDQYRYARDVAGLDFLSVSCHAEYFGTRMAWEAYKAEATGNNDPGRFVTFYGYEWAGAGHINAYFLQENEAQLLYGSNILKGVHPADDPPFRKSVTTDLEFQNTLKSITDPVIAIGHVHTRYESCDADIVPLFEIHSTHHLEDLEAKLRTLWAEGKNFGVVSGGDAHRFPMGHLVKNPGLIWDQGGKAQDDNTHGYNVATNGLQATFASELSRQSLYKGMKRRHTYGTDGERIVILFQTSGGLMGDKAVPPAGQKPVFDIKVGGTADILEICVWKHDEEGWTQPFLLTKPGGDLWEDTWEDSRFRGSARYYLRITQIDGSRAWSSSIQIEEG